MQQDHQSFPSRGNGAPPSAAWGVVGVVMLGNFLGPLYSSTSNVIIPNLIASFGSDVNTMQWVVTGYMLGYSITMPLAGWLADVYGRRRMYLIGLTIFTIASILTSFAWIVPALIGLRVLQAVGGGIISPTGMAIITDVVPQNQRGRALGLWGMGMMLAPAFGPWISGLIVDNLHDWRLVFLLGVPFGIAGLFAAAKVLPKSEDRRTNIQTGTFDFLGFGFLTGALVAFLVPLSQGNRVGWNDSAIVLSFVASSVLFAIFIIWELRITHPMLNLRLFRDRVFSVAVILRAMLGMGYYFSIFLLPLFTQVILGWDPTLSGLILLPAGLAMGVLMPISGTLADRVGARYLVFSGMIMAAYGTFLFSRIDTNWSASHITLDNMFRTAALGLLFTPLTTAAISNVHRLSMGAASAIINTVWQVGGSIGIAVGQAYLTAQTAVRLNAVASGVTFHNPAVQIFIQNMEAHMAAPQMAHFIALATLGHIAMLDASVRAYGDTFFLGAAVIAICAPLSLLLPRKRAEVTINGTRARR